MKVQHMIVIATKLYNVLNISDKYQLYFAHIGFPKNMGVMPRATLLPNQLPVIFFYRQW